MSENVLAAPRRLTWRTAGLLVLAVLVIGQGVAIARPVWFAPPQVMITPLLYLGLALAWIPVLVVCILRRPQGRAGLWLFRLIVVGGLCTAFWWVLMSPAPGWALADVDHVTCTSDAASGGLVRHTCTHAVRSRVETVVLEGQAGSPFARLVESSYSGS